jgi:hypothetical protein
LRAYGVSKIGRSFKDKSHRRDIVFKKSCQGLFGEISPSYSADFGDVFFKAKNKAKTMRYSLDFKENKSVIVDVKRLR